MVEFTGIWLGVITFLCIWLGHVGVRWLEAHSVVIWPPALILLLTGLGLNIFSLFMPTVLLAGIPAVIGTTLMWDSLEMYRQQSRVRKGHSPANPNNPRHATYLAAGTATTNDLLKREPYGVPEELSSLPAHAGKETYPGVHTRI